MDLQKRYETVLAEIPGKAAAAAAQGRAPVFGFTSNLDVVLQWNADVYNEILRNHLKEAPSAKEGDVIRTVEDFARISSFFVMRGLGANYDIADLSVCQYLRQHFSEEFSLGGTAAQGAAALGAVGLPVNIHLTDDCREVCVLLDHPGTTVIRDGEVVPVREAAGTEAPVYHFILQFAKGDVIHIGGEDFVIPHSNRLIFFYDTVHKHVPIREDCLRYWETEIPGAGQGLTPAAFLMSGFDAIVEEKRMQEIADRLEGHLTAVRRRFPGVPVYFESAYYMNSAVKAVSFERLSPYVDIFGMNEEELEEQMGRLGRHVDTDRPDSVVSALTDLLSLYPARGFILHTKDYAMYYGAGLKGIDLEAGLIMGNVMASTRARVGRYGSLEDCAETLKLPFSEAGLAFCEACARLETGEKTVIAAPSKYLEHPKYTIGLGDTFVAGVHTCFI